MARKNLLIRFMKKGRQASTLIMKQKRLDKRLKKLIRDRNKIIKQVRRR